MFSFHFTLNTFSSIEMDLSWQENVREFYIAYVDMLHDPTELSKSLT